MYLGNRLAVGEAVDCGVVDRGDVDRGDQIPAPEPAPEPTRVQAGSTVDPVTATAH